MVVAEMILTRGGGGPVRGSRSAAGQPLQEAACQARNQEEEEEEEEEEGSRHDQEEDL